MGVGLDEFAMHGLVKYGKAVTDWRRRHAANNRALHEAAGVLVEEHTGRALASTLVPKDMAYETVLWALHDERRCRRVLNVKTWQIEFEACCTMDIAEMWLCDAV